MLFTEIVRRIYLRNEGNIWEEANTFNSNENLVRNCVLWSMFFTSMYPLIDWILHSFFAKGIQHLVDDKKRYKDFVGFLYSLIHHLVVVPWAVLCLYSECMQDDEEWKLINFAVEYSFLPPYCFGYLMGDFIMYAIPAARQGRVEMLVHHVLGLALIVAACLTTTPVVRFQVHMIMLESSSICFSFAWFARNFGYENSIFVTIMEFSFTLLFFFFRIVHLCFILYALQDVLWSTYPILCAIFAPLLALQFYWFFLIVTYKKKKSKKAEKLGRRYKSEKRTDKLN